MSKEKEPDFVGIETGLVTKEERRIKRALGISQIQAWTRPSRG